MSWRTLSDSYYVVDDVLQLPPSQKRRIEREFATEDDRKKAAVMYWLRSHPYASWRLLITQLDWKRKHAVANDLQQYAEKLTGMLSSYLYYH